MDATSPRGSPQQLQRPLYAMAMSVSATRIDLIRRGGTELHSFEPPTAFVATLQPGVRGVDLVDCAGEHRSGDGRCWPTPTTPRSMQVLPPDAATIDLAEADRIVAGGAGLDDARRFDQLADARRGAAAPASAPPASSPTAAGSATSARSARPAWSSTRSCTSPSGSAARCSTPAGSVSPTHIISVNTDPHCPMMQLADLAVVADANAVLDAARSSSCPNGSRSRMADTDFDVVVVGAGPAGSCAAIEAARAGLRTLLLERGPFPGSKNMYGGVVYPRILDDLIPEWWDEAPVQRWVTRRSTMVLTDTQALTVDFRSDAWGAPPYNGATAYRPDFDHWLAGQAEAAGATLLCDTTVTGLLRGDRTRGRLVTGVRTDRPDGDLTASRRHRLRRRQQLPRQGGRALRHRRRQATSRSA